MARDDRNQEVRCPVHGFIQYGEEEERLTNTFAIQRLRGIHQLAMAYHVYPGCRHTRFEHSLGVMHLAGRMAEHLECNTEEVRLVRLAGLLHDCGHAPFSHVSEQLLETLTSNAPEGVPKDKLHERVTVDIVRHDPEIAAILSKADRDGVIKTLDTVGFSQRRILRDAVSGPLDADKLDYLLRDSHYAGVQYGIFDLDRVIHCLCRIDASEGEEQIGVTDQGVPQVEQVLFARHHMTGQVYLHRIRSITDAMIVKGVMAAVDEGINGVADVFNYDAEDPTRFIAKYMSVDERTLIDRIRAAANGSLAKNYFERLAFRRLLKQVLRVELSEHLGDAVFLNKLVESLRDDMARKEHEEALAKVLGVHEGLVIVDYRSLSNPTYRSPGVDIQPKDIIVQTKRRGRRLFNKESLLFGDHQSNMSREHLCVYAPVDIDDRSERKKKIAELTRLAEKHFGIDRERRNGQG